MNREKSLLKNTFILSIGTLLPKFAVFITLPIYIRYLTKAEYGTYDLILTLISLIIPIVTLQIQSAIFRRLVVEENISEKTKAISTTYTFIGLISILISIISISFIKNIDIYSEMLIIIYFILDTIYQVTLQIARGLGKNKEYSKCSVITSFLNLIFVVPFLMYFKMGLSGVILVMIISEAIGLIYLIRKGDIRQYFRLKEFNKYELKELLIYSIPLVPNSVSWWLVNSCNRLIVTFFLGIESNAVYAAANKIPHMYNIMYNAFQLAWQESASKTYEDQDVEKYYSIVFNNLFKLLTSGMLILISSTPIVFVVLLNESYIDAYSQIPILYIAMFLCSFATFFSGIYIAIKKTNKIASTSIIAAVINVILSIVLINTIGLYAASISTLIAYLVMTVHRAIDLRKYFKLEYNYRSIISYFILIIISTILCYINNFVLNIFNVIFAVISSYIINKSNIKAIYSKGKKYISKKIIKDN